VNKVTLLPSTFHNPGLQRRRLLCGGVALAAWAVGAGTIKALEPDRATSRGHDVEAMYGPLSDEPFPVPAVDVSKLNPAYYRQLVDYETDEITGTVVVDTHNRVLYLTLPEGKAIRYGVGVGRDGFAWSGHGEIRYKKAWPTWTPPAEMIEREPELEQYRNGMPPGLHNPLGARALYIYQGNADTLYRVHGSGEVLSIGRAVSSGCVRLLHQDVIDLYNRVPEHTPIVVT
jgi:lipoprotein-anchoring transpeptidase ErfK/SrfK